MPFVAAGDAPEGTPRLLINREAVGLARPLPTGPDGAAGSDRGAARSSDEGGDGGSDGSSSSASSYRSEGFDFEPAGTGAWEDVLHLGSCDDGVRQLCRLLGWEADLDARIAATAAARAALLQAGAEE